MDQRIHDRLPVSIEIRVTNLERKDHACRGRVIDVSQSGVALLLPERYETQDLLQFDAPDSVLFGHVVYVEETADGYRTGVEVEQVLLGTSDLCNLVEALASEAQHDVNPVDN